MEEIFRVYKETNSRPWGHRIYEVSNFGRVKLNGEIFEPVRIASGYYVLSGEYLHKIVAKLFIPNPDNKTEVDHINTIRTDNRVENLRWVTRSENRLNPISMKHHSDANKGRTAWNKGLTKETDERVAKYGRTRRGV